MKNDSKVQIKKLLELKEKVRVSILGNEYYTRKELIALQSRINKKISELEKLSNQSSE